MEEYEKNILKNINLISEDLVSEIFLYINLELLIMTNKNYYFKYHKLIKKNINPNRYESYIRDMVRKDNSFTFVTKTAPASYLIKKAIGITSGSAEPHKEKVASITRDQLQNIAEFSTEA